MLVLLFPGTARERWIDRSDEPVRRYVPGELENVMALTGPGELWSDLIGASASVRGGSWLTIVCFEGVDVLGRDLFSCRHW